MYLKDVVTQRCSTLLIFRKSANQHHYEDKFPGSPVLELHAYCRGLIPDWRSMILQALETGLKTEKKKKKKKKHTTVRYHLTLAGTAVIIKKSIKQSTTSVKENVEKGNTCSLCWGI